MELTDFRNDILNQVHARASVDGIFTANAFMEEAAELLISAGEIDSLDVLSFSGTGRRRQSLAVNGFVHDEQDSSVSLVVVRFHGGLGLPTITQTDAAAGLRALEQFLREALAGDFLIDREPSTPEYQLAQTLNQLYGRDGSDSIRRFRLYLITDAQLSSRAKSIDSAELDGTPMDSHIWDIQRFHQVHESKQGREPLELTIDDWEAGGVPALRVADSAGDITTYLAALPGRLLAALYRRHGSRLLEGNVRSFLTARGKINRGIRDTISNEPSHFLAYNNGISATASKVEFQDGCITGITDLQIVNGGQTTASLFYATQGGRGLPLDDVFVQMKLVVVDPESAQEMVPLISRYANSQNAVREDDFFSNSPFHVRMEDLSKRILAPAQAGANFQTKWYYERTRGQYLNERNRRNAGEQKKFVAEFPRNQVLTKTDVAKYVVSWNQDPHQVSAGAQKNFKAFAALVAEKYGKQPESFTENYYRRVVAQAIMYNAVRSAISKADWYESGYLANLTTYAVAKLSLEIERNPRAKSFDLLRIWEAQSVSEPIVKEAVRAAHLALGVLTSDDRLTVNVTEWAKKESAWKRLAALRFELSEDFLGATIPVTLNANGEPAVTLRSRFSADVPEQEHVEGIAPDAWRSMQVFLSGRGLLNASEARLIRQAVGGTRSIVDIGTARALLRLYVKALNSGWSEDTVVMDTH